MTQQHVPGRRMSGKRAALLLAGVGLTAGGVYAAHAVQVNRNAAAMRVAAKQAAADNRNEEAVDLYLRYLNFQPKDAEALAEYADLLDRTRAAHPKAVQERIDTLDRLVRLDPTRADTRRQLVKIFLEQTAYTAARSHLEALLDPARGGKADDAVALTQLAACEQRTGKPTEAIELLRKAVTTGRAEPEAYLLLAEMLAADPEQEGEADRVIDKLAADRGTLPAARVGRARYLFARNRPADARAELEAAAAGADAASDPDLVLLLADLYSADNRATAARELLTKAVAVRPTDARLRLVFADLLARQNDRPASDAQAKEAVKHTADSDPLGLELVDWLIDRRDHATARTEADRRFGRTDITKPVHDYFTGRLKLADGDWPAALALLKTAAGAPVFERLPRFHAKLLLAIGDAHRLGNNPDRAAEAYTSAARLAPGAGEPAARLADVQAALGKPAEAQAMLARLNTTPAARAASARLALGRELSRPPEQRNWAKVEAALGPPPLSADGEAVRVALLEAQGKGSAEAWSAAIRRFPADVPLRLLHAAAVARTDPAAGVKVLDQAANEAGDRSAFRLAKAVYLARSGADATAIQTVGANADALPANERANLFLGLGELLYQGLNQPKPAAGWLRKAADAAPFDLPSRSLLVEVLSVLNRPVEADAALAEIVKLDGADGPHALFARAVREFAAGKPTDPDTLAKTAKLLEASVAKRESWPRPHAVLGRLAELGDRPEAAVTHYRRAYELGDRSSGVVRSYVAVLTARGQHADALRVLEDRERAGALTDDLKKQYAVAEVMAGKASDRAAKLADQVAGSKSAQDQLFRGRLLMLNGDAGGAAAAFEKVVELEPKKPEGWVELVNARVRRNDPAGARAAAEKAAATLGPDLPLWAGKLKVLLGDLPAAEKLFTEARAKTPSDPNPIYQLAVLHASAGMIDSAEADYRSLAGHPSAADSAKRWARRMLAYSVAGRPAGFAKLADALALVEQNLPADDPADKRAKGILLSIDPFRRAEGKTLIDSVRGLSVGPEEALRIGRLAEAEGDLSGAEEAYREAATGPAADPNHLAILHKTQLARARTKQAEETLRRLTAAAPGAWVTAVAAARQTAASDKPAAAKGLLAFPAAKDAVVRADLVAPMLLDIGCAVEAEAVYREVAERTALPGRQARLAGFLARQGRWAEALPLIAAMSDTDAAPAIRGRLLREAVGRSPRPSVPPADQPKWDELAAAAATWAEARAADPQMAALAGVIADARGKYDDAVRFFEQSLAAAPNQPDVKNNLAVLLLLHKKGGAVRPKELIEQAIAAVGPQPPLLDTRATIALAAGQNEEAVRDLQAAVRLTRKPAYLFRLAVAHDKQEQPGPAAEYLNQAKKLGLKREHLHPLDWPEYDRLAGS